MDRLKRFAQYVEEKTAGLERGAKTSIMADITAKSPKKPEKNGKYPSQPDNTGHNSVLPYGPEYKDVGLLMAEPDGKPPLAAGPTPGLTPEKSASLGVRPKGRPGVLKTSRKQLKEFYEATKNMSDAAFVNYLMEQKDERPPVSMVHDLHGEPFTPHPHEAISFICSLMHNPKMVSRLVREVKKHGHMGQFVAELMDHPEFYDEAVEMMGDKDEGKKITDKFASTMLAHHENFKKDNNIRESSFFRGRLLAEKVGPSLVDDEEDADYAGIPTPDDGKGGTPMQASPEEREDEPGLDTSKDDVGQMDADGNEIDQENDGEGLGLGDDSGPTSPGWNAGSNMAKGLKGTFGDDHFKRMCADGKC